MILLHAMPVKLEHLKLVMRCKVEMQAVYMPNDIDNPAASCLRSTVQLQARQLLDDDAGQRDTCISLKKAAEPCRKALRDFVDVNQHFTLDV